MKQETRIKKQGFSLIELLVVMTIIIVISAVAMVNYAGAGKKARDSRRIADLEKIRMALEAVRQVGNTYPVASAGQASGLVPTYLSIWPADPKANSYTYTQDTPYTYHIDAVMEDLGSTNMAGNIYRVTNL